MDTLATNTETLMHRQLVKTADSVVLVDLQGKSRVYQKYSLYSRKDSS